MTIQAPFVLSPDSGQGPYKPGHLRLMAEVSLAWLAEWL